MSTRATRAGRPADRRWLGQPRWAATILLGGLALLVALVVLVGSSPVARAQGRQSGVALQPAHALPVRSEPAPNAILKTPPSQVKIWFSEALNPLASRIVVVDTTNHEVDNRDSRVDMSTQTEMTVGLQLLRPGTYVVVWRTQSAVDGHVTGGSYIFRVANADGSVPPVPATLPSGNVPGAAGFGSTPQAVDAPTLLQTLSDWLALLCALFWVGGLIWEAWVLPARRSPSPTVAAGARLAATRFQRLAPWALAGALLADFAMALALTVQVAGSWSGAVSVQYWQATIFSGSFAVYWWMRQIVLGVALALAILRARSARHAPDAAPSSQAGALVDAAPAALASGDEPIPSWTRAALDVIRQTPRLPRRLARGWLDLTPLRQAEVALGGLLLFAFTMSGHAAATAPDKRNFAIAVDLAHLIFSSAWLGGLLYISVVLIPAARALPERAQALLLARGAPEFGVVAIVSAAALALTGPLDATVHLTSLAQLATTAYGRTLFVKSEIFLIMVAISAFHAFWLRPRLNQALARSAEARATLLREVAGIGAQRPAQGVAVASAEYLLADDAPDATQPRLNALSPHHAAQNGHSHAASQNGASSAEVRDEMSRLRARMEDWLRREALAGVGVLLCVALLTLFAGTLAPAQAAISVSNAGAFKQTQTAGGYAITLQVTPAKFGANTFTVTLADAQGKPVQGASTLIQTQDLDMDMGAQSAQLQPVGASQPGVYSAQSDLTMAGHWQVTVKVLPPGAKTFITTTYKLSAGS